MNLSTVSNEQTARTNIECAYQRAENLAVLGVRSVLELCAGPSLKALEEAYSFYNINVTGNDIDPRWKDYYPDGKWLIGDCLKVNWDAYDAVVFAPPLSKGCSGKREDALKISQIFPRYRDFMWKLYDGIRCMVLPARSLSTFADRNEFFRLLGTIDRAEVVPLHAGARKIRKYVDVYYRD
jgi:hypothetical protein